MAIHQERVDRYRQTFRSRWMAWAFPFARFASLTMAFIALLGLAAKSAVLSTAENALSLVNGSAVGLGRLLGFDRRSEDGVLTALLNRRSSRRPAPSPVRLGKILHESLEARQLLAVDVQFTNSSSTRDEGGVSGTAPIISVNGTLASPATLNFNVLGGTATSTVDYNRTSLVLPAGTYSNQQFNLISLGHLNIVNDATVEDDETVQLAVTSTSGEVTVGAIGSHVHSITEDDTASIAFITGTSNVSETSGSSHPVQVRLDITPGPGSTGTELIQAGFSVTVSDLGTGTATSGGTGLLHDESPNHCIRCGLNRRRDQAGRHHVV